MKLKAKINLSSLEAEVDFSKGNKKVEIICPKHGIFRVFRRNHLRGDKCNKWQDLERGLKRRIKNSFAIF